jgi:hypothetical protein
VAYCGFNHHVLTIISIEALTSGKKLELRSNSVQIYCLKECIHIQHDAAAILLQAPSLHDCFFIDSSKVPVIPSDEAMSMLMDHKLDEVLDEIT